MHQPHGVEEHAVAPGEIHRQHGRLRAPHQRAHVRAPGRLRHAAARFVVGHLARGEDGQRPAVLQEAQRLLHGAEVLLRRVAPAEGIHRDDVRAYLLHGREERVRHHLQVRPVARHHRGEHAGIQDAEGVVRHHDERPRLRHLEVRRHIHIVGRVHRAQHGLEPRERGGVIGMLLVKLARGAVGALEVAKGQGPLQQRPGHLVETALHGRVEMLLEVEKHVGLAWGWLPLILPVGRASRKWRDFRPGERMVVAGPLSAIMAGSTPRDIPRL